MSVINRMLHDLDARGAAQPVAQAAPQPASQPALQSAMQAGEASPAMGQTRRVFNIPDTPYQVNARARQRRSGARWRMRLMALAALTAVCVYSTALVPQMGASLQRLKQQVSWLWQPSTVATQMAHPVAPVAPSPLAVAAAAAPIAADHSAPSTSTTQGQGLAMDWTLSALVSESHAAHRPRPVSAMQVASHAKATPRNAQGEPRVMADAAAVPAAVPATPAGPTAPAAQAAAAQLEASSKYAGSERRYTMIDPPAAGFASSPVARAAAAYRRALDLSDEGRDTAALDTALEALRIDPQHAAARRLAVTLALNLNRIEQAQAWIDEGLKADPNDAEMQYLRARALVVSGLNEQALVALQGQSRPTADALGLKAGLLARDGQYPQAARAYEQALRDQPTNATWWLGLGVAFDAQGQAAPARNAFTRARALGTLRNDLQAWVEQKLASSN